MSNSQKKTMLKNAGRLSQVGFTMVNLSFLKTLLSLTSTRLGARSTLMAIAREEVIATLCILRKSHRGIKVTFSNKCIMRTHNINRGGREIGVGREKKGEIETGMEIEIEIGIEIDIEIEIEREIDIEREMIGREGVIERVGRGVGVEVKKRRMGME
jgi:hypothetical protein